MTASEVEQIVVELKSLQVNQNKIERKVNEIHQGLYGVTGTKENGLVGDLQSLKSDYYGFKHKVIVVLAVGAGSGGIGAAIAKLLGG